MSGAATAVAIGSTALSIAGKAQEANAQAQQANAQAGMSRYQAQVARNNQLIAEGYAQRAEQQGRVDEQNQRFKTSSLMGSQRAALASQGGDINSGSPLDIVGDTARAGEFDAQTVRNNAALKAYGYRVQGFNNAADAGLSDLRATDADQKAASTMAALPFSIGSSLLSGASSLFGKGLFKPSPPPPNGSAASYTISDGLV